jgi:hypothetical protein
MFDYMVLGDGGRKIGQDPPKADEIRQNKTKTRDKIKCKTNTTTKRREDKIR